MRGPQRGTATVRAPANIAFIKYWGAIDLDRVVPANASISMTLSECVSTTTVACLEDGRQDRVELLQDDGTRVPADPDFSARVVAHLERLRRFAGVGCALSVLTRNSFPAAAGMASSASGFAALTLATMRALGRQLEVTELSRLARLSGSGSAARSVLGGYVEWPVSGDSDLAAAQIAAPEHWDLCDVVALVQSGPKEVSSRDGHRRAGSSPHYARRLALLPRRLAAVRAAIEQRDLGTLGPILEEDAIELHLIAMSSRPPIFYWAPASLRVLACVHRLRQAGVSAWATMDAGANVHVICEPTSTDAVAEALLGTEGVASVIRDRVGPGPVVLTESGDADPSAVA